MGWQRWINTGWLIGSRAKRMWLGRNSSIGGGERARRRISANLFQFAANRLRRGRTFLGSQRRHPPNQIIKCGRNVGRPFAHRWNEQTTGQPFAGQQHVHCRAQTVQIRPWLGLAAVLFGRRVAGRTHLHRVLMLAFLEGANNAKINQHQLAVGRSHNIRRLQITKHQRRPLAMQIIQHGA